MLYLANSKYLHKHLTTKGQRRQSFQYLIIICSFSCLTKILIEGEK